MINAGVNTSADPNGAKSFNGVNSTITTRWYDGLLAVLGLTVDRMNARLPCLAFIPHDVVRTLYDKARQVIEPLILLYPTSGRGGLYALFFISSVM